MAIYAADIQINVQNKGDLKKLESRFEKLSKSSVKLEKTLKNLSKRNVVQVDTKAAFAAIQKLETKIRGLSRTIRVDATTSGGSGRRGSGRRESGGGGAAVPMLAAAMSSSKASSSSLRDTAAFDAKKDLLGIASQATAKQLDALIKKEAEYKSFAESSNESVIRGRKAQKQALLDLNFHDETRVNNAKTINDLVTRQTNINKKRIDQAGKWGDMLKNLSTLSSALSITAFEGNFKKRGKDYLDIVQKTNDEVKRATELNKQHMTALERIRKQKGAAEEPDKVMKALSISERDVQLFRELDTAIATALDKSFKLTDAQNKFVAETAKGGPATKATVDGLKQAEDAARRAAAEVNKIHKALATPPSTGLIGGMKSLGVGGAGKAFGKGALGASAMIPGLTPFTIGAAAGGVGKTGGAALAGGAMGIAGAGVVMGGLALGNFIKQATIASSEMKKMELALTAVVTSNEEYNKALTSIDEISNKLLIPQAKVTKAFTRLQAAASASGYEVNDVKDLMKGFSSALIATEGDAKNFNGVMLALSQVLGKGKAAAEEIRGQIGERLSVVIPELAASMKIEVKELDKLFDQGKVTVQDIFNLSRHLEEKYGKSSDNILKSQMNAGERLLFAMTELQLALGPIFEDIGAGFQNLATAAVEATTDMVNAISKLLGIGLENQINNLKGQLEFWKSFLEIQESVDTQIKSVPGLKRGLEGTSGFEGTKGFVAALEKRIKELEEKLEVKTTGKAGTKPDSSKDDAKLQASWEKAKKNLEDQRKFQDKLNEGGTAYAEKWRKINELASQFPDKPREEIEKLVTDVEKAEKAGKSAKAVYEDWLDGINKRLKELESPMYQLTTLVDAASDSFRESFKEMVKGTKSVGDAFIDMFNRITDAYLDMVAETLAAQASKGIGSFFKNFALNALSGGFGSALSGSTLATNVGDVSWRTAVNAPSLGYASGGYTDRPVNAVIGDAGPEYVLREDQMAGALARFSSGQRGQSVIPVAGSSSSGGVGGGGNVTVSYTGPTLNFNGDEYVPRSSVPEIISAAARQGAKAGEARMMSSLKNNRGARASVGL